MGNVASEHAPRLVVAASFTADPLQEPLAFFTNLLDLPHGIAFAPYHQVFQELLSPASSLGTNTAGANLLLVRLEDYLRARPKDGPSGSLPSNGGGARATIERTRAELTRAIASFANRSTVPLLVVLFPCSPSVSGELASLVARANEELRAELGALPSVVLLELGGHAPRPALDFDTARDDLAHIPFTEAYFSTLARLIARRLHALRVPAHKVLVLDCDNTLWGGVVGEDGPHALDVAGPFAALQRFAIEQQSRGVLICLCSKNAESDVFDVFSTRSDMLLRLEHVVAHRINWEPKAQNLISLAEALNLGLDSFVFVDDNPVECGQMRMQLPQVTTLVLPPPAEVERFLENLWVFDKLSVTDEDRKRTLLYQQNRERERFENESLDIADFLAGLALEVELSTPNDGDIPRASQLTQRTNQFNFTTTRRSENEIKALGTQSLDSLKVHVRDRFGDYGLVGLLVFGARDEALVVDTLLLSCRVLGRGVEHAMLRKLGQVAGSRNLATVRLPLHPTPRNEPARAFADAVAGQFRIDHADHSTYEIPAAFAANVAHKPGDDPEAVVQARRSEGKKKPSPTTQPAPGKSERYQRIAGDLADPIAVLALIRQAGERVRALEQTRVPPANDTEKNLVALFEEVLGVRDIGVEDDYFLLGGTSLLAVSLFVEIAARFGVSLPLTTIVEAPTVRSLSRRLTPEGVDRDDVIVEFKPGGAKALFLVHDGDGETLLYRGLARRMPTDVAVYGIAPRRLPGVALAHTRIEDMAAFYVAELRRRRPTGPYFLGGMCAGGTIAFEMASQLERAGERVSLVAVLDAATPDAPRRKNLVATRRWQRFSSELTGGEQNGSLLGRTTSIARTVTTKVRNLLTYEVQRRGSVASASLRYRVLERILDRSGDWPSWLPALTVRQIYELAESQYCPNIIRKSRVVLVRATEGVGSDEPYSNLYDDPLLGWQRYVDHTMEAISVPGGHSSMLQEPAVDSLAREFVRLIEASEKGAGPENGSL